MKILGPEFQRNVWLRFSGFNLALMPVLLGIILVLTYLSNLGYEQSAGAISALNNNHPLAKQALIPLHWSYGSHYVMVSLLVIMLFIVGIQEAASSFTSELRDKTWDMQKISAISPIHIVIGKLFGTTSYVWYFSFGLIACILYVYSHVPLDRKVLPEVAVYPDFSDIVLLGFLIVFCAFTGHLIAAVVSIQSLVRGVHSSFRGLVAGFIFSFFTYSILRILFDIPLVAEDLSLLRNAPTIHWYGGEFKTNLFLFYVLLFFVFWAFVGLYRLVRTELNFQRYPFVWLLFLLSLSALFAGMGVKEIESVSFGYLTERKKAFQFSFIPFCIFFVALYSSVYSYSSNLSGYLRLLNAVREKNIKRVLETLPDWIAILPFILILLALVSLNKISHVDSVNMRLFLVACLLFLARDGFMMHFIYLGNRFKRAGILFILYIAFAYVIIPMFVFNIIRLFDGGIFSNGQGWDAFLEGSDPFAYVIAVFYPFVLKSGGVLFLLPVLVQTVLFGVLLWRVIVRYKEVPARP